MYSLYLVSVWLHILAAIVWIGGMFFLVLVVVPWLRRGKAPEAAVFLRETGTRFRNVGWIAFGILFATGIFNLWFRGVRPSHLVDPEWLATPFAHIVLLKLGIFALVLTVSAIHDFVLGPRATAAIESAPRSAEALVLRRRASLLGRLNVVLGLVLVAAGVLIVRGAPW
jgi:putative copper resistance protein D